MSSVTYTISDDLEPELDEVARERNVTPAEVIDAAVRKYLAERRQERSTAESEEFVPFWLPVVPEEDDHGEPDVSINHDYYLAEDLYQRKFSELERNPG